MMQVLINYYILMVNFKRIHVFHYQMLVQVVSPVGQLIIYQKGLISRVGYILLVNSCIFTIFTYQMVLLLVQINNECYMLDQVFHQIYSSIYGGGLAKNDSIYFSTYFSIDYLIIYHRFLHLFFTFMSQKVSYCQFHIFHYLLPI